MESKKIAFLFPGQGSQVVGMGKELAAMYTVAQHTFDEADEALGFKLSKLCFEGPEDQLKLTENTQPAMLTVSVAAARVLAEVGIKADSPPDTVSASTRPTLPPEPWSSPTPSAPCAIADATCRKRFPSGRAPWRPFSAWNWKRSSRSARKP